MLQNRSSRLLPSFAIRGSVMQRYRNDLSVLLARYPRTISEEHGIDFERLAHDYDALHLTTDNRSKPA